MTTESHQRTLSAIHGAAIQQPGADRPGVGRKRQSLRRQRWLVPVVAIAALATACSTGPGSQEELTQILTDTGLSETQAGCISQAVFDEYAEDEDALSKISAAPDLEFLNGEEGVPGFSDFFDATVSNCAASGPTPSN